MRSKQNRLAIKGVLNSDNAEILCKFSCNNDNAWPAYAHSKPRLASSEWERIEHIKEVDDKKNIRG